MKISKKRWKNLEKRVANLEKSMESHAKDDISPLSVMKAALRESLYQAPQATRIDIKLL